MLYFDWFISFYKISLKYSFDGIKLIFCIILRKIHLKVLIFKKKLILYLFRYFKPCYKALYRKPIYQITSLYCMIFMLFSSLRCDIRIHSTNANIFIRDTDYGSSQYHDKATSREYMERPYAIDKANYTASR